MLRCVAPYTNPALDIDAKPGDMLWVAPLLEADLLRDAPGCWEWIAGTPRTTTRIILSAGARKEADRGDQA